MSGADRGTSEGPRAGRVSAARIRELFETIGAHGRTGDGGCERLAFSAAERAARADLLAAGRRLGFEAFTDEIGSVFLVRPAGVPRAGEAPAATPPAAEQPAGTARGDAAAHPRTDHTGNLSIVLTGSHLDTVPAGGCFDGASGVLCGVAALELIEAAGIRTKLPIGVVSWANEEGTRFVPAMMGSGVFTGAVPVEEARSAQDASGVTVEQELSAESQLLTHARGPGRAGPDTPRPRRAGAARHASAGSEPDTPGPRLTPAAYLELHPEQGRTLESAGVPLGVVEGVQGQVSGDWIMTGRADHAGATPMDDRADALRAASRLVAAVAEVAAENPPGVATVGALSVEPGARNAVPGRVRGTLDIRHPDDRAVQRILDGVLEAGRRAAEGAGCTFEWHPAWTAASVRFADSVREATARAAETCGARYARIASGAGHDAVRLSAVCPSGMVFVPSRNGISHSPREHTSYDDLAAGATVLAEALLSLAGIADEPSGETGG